MQTSSVDHHNQAGAYADGIKDKLDELRQLNARMADLCNSAQQHLQSLGNEDGQFRAEMKLQVEMLERFKSETALIEGLRDRLRVEQEKVRDYERRIERVQSRVDAQKDKESSWRKRASWRMRLLWGFIAVLVILWLLATPGGDVHNVLVEGEPVELTPPNFAERLEYGLDSLPLV